MAESRLNLAMARCPSCGSMGLVVEEWPLTPGEIAETGRKKLPVLICEARCGWHAWGWYQGRRMVFGNFWTIVPEGLAE